jgi:hypothetical protein
MNVVRFIANFSLFIGLPQGAPELAGALNGIVETRFKK